MGRESARGREREGGSAREREREGGRKCEREAMRYRESFAYHSRIFTMRANTKEMRANTKDESIRRTMFHIICHESNTCKLEGRICEIVCLISFLVSSHSISYQIRDFYLR